VSIVSHFDLDPFFADFGDSASATVNGQTRTFTVVFDSTRKAIDAGSGRVIDLLPSCMVKTASVEGLLVDDAITIAGTAYTIADRENDGQGLTRLMLRE
jgi:hypothetical protein